MAKKTGMRSMNRMERATVARALTALASTTESDTTDGHPANEDGSPANGAIMAHRREMADAMRALAQQIYAGEVG
jgi:hypothetical protein